jgi:hypothetical protein
MMDYEYRGKTDLSIKHQRMPVSLGGFENKISSVKLTKMNHKGLEILNAEGIKAVSQAGTQILGSSCSLDSFMIPNIAISTIATNGVSWILTRRHSVTDSNFIYWHYMPITLAYQDSAGVWQLKDSDDICYDQVCHIFGLLMDNVDYLLQATNLSRLISVFPKLSVIEEDSNEDDYGDNDNGDNDDSLDDGDMLARAGDCTSRNPSSSLGQGAAGGGQSCKSSKALPSSSNVKTALGVGHMNVRKHIALTKNALTLQNGLYKHRDYLNCLDSFKMTDTWDYF